MKYLFLLFSLLSIMVSCSFNSTNEANVGDRTTFEVDRVVFDAGEVKKGETVTAKFKVTNTGKTEMVISEIKASCSCTVADKPEKPLAPGESTTIVAYMKTDKVNLGLVEKNVYMMANTNPDKTTLKIRAIVRN